MWNQIQLSLPPASRIRTRLLGLADSRLAMMQPAVPAPTTIWSKSPSIRRVMACFRPVLLHRRTRFWDRTATSFPDYTAQASPGHGGLVMLSGEARMAWEVLGRPQRHA